MYFIISALFLGWLLHWTVRKKDVPKFIHGFFYSQRDYDEKKNGSKTSLITLFWLLLVTLIFAACVGVLGPFFQVAGYWMFSAFILWLVVFVLVAKTFRRKFDLYAVDLKEYQKKQAIRDAHKAKQMATLNDLASVVSKNGYYIGAPHHHWFGDGNALIVGSTGSGKNAALILPNFLSHLFTVTGTSIFCIDPKGENYFISKRWLESQGYKVYRLNPTDIFEIGSDSFNLFSMINPNSPDVFAFCQKIASALCPVTGKSETSDHFNEKAQGLLTMYMLHMLHQYGTSASFITLYEWVTMEGKRRIDMLEKMAESKAYDGVVASEANGILTGFEMGGDREMSGVYSSAAKSLKAFRDLQLRHITRRSDFSLEELVEKPTAVFINIPFTDLENSAGWIRAMIAILNRMMEKRQNRDRRVLVMLDEFTRLGHIREVQDGFVTMRSFGVNYHVVVQDMQQLQTNYPGSYKAFFSSSAVKHVLSVEDHEMAKILSDMTGKDVDTVEIGDGHSPHIVEKPVVSPDEFQNNHDHHYLFVRGMPNVIKLPKVYYFNNPDFNGRWDKNPLHRKSYHS